MDATYSLIKTTIINTPTCPDGPTQACASCLAEAVAEALEVGAAKERHPAGKKVDGQLDIMQAVCAHVWPPDLDEYADCQLCGLFYAEWIQ